MVNSCWRMLYLLPKAAIAPLQSPMDGQGFTVVS